MSDSIITGGCLCGRIRYRVTGKTVWSGYCHCESCRRFSGAVVTSWLGVADSDLDFTASSPQIYEVNGVRRGFCADCGSSLTYAADRFPDYVQIHVGTLDDPDAIKPQDHVHCEEKVTWLEISDDLPRHHGSAADDNNDWMKG